MSSHAVKRPRLALSCVVCRRRKVKCGKEKPQCHNCERLGEICSYDTGVRDTETGRVLRAAEFEENGPRPAELTSHDQERVFNEQVTSSDGNQIPLASDHLSLQRGARVRHIGRTFWGFVNGREALSDGLFYDEKTTPSDLPPSHISAVSLAKVLFVLPTRPAADALVRSFFVSVYPIHPVVDTLTFQSDYEAFWEWARSGDLYPPPKLVEDPTFTCLLFAVLYAGASGISLSRWTDGPPTLRCLNRETTISQLENACADSLSACRHSEHPTLNTLVGSILFHVFAKIQSSTDDALFIAKSIRLAQSMGLHQENNIPDLDSTREHRRQIWWHLVWLDIQSSLASSLPTCLDNSALGGVQMISAPENSAVKLLAIGRYEAARLQNQIMHQFQNVASRNKGEISQETVKELLEAARSLGRLIDNLIAKIPDFKDPKDIFPDDLTEASPESHFALYQDEGKAPTLIGALARTSLFLVKLEVATMLKKSLLGPPDSISSERPWNRIYHLSLVYIRKYLRLCRAPAFEPYLWFLAEYYGPQQSSLLILVYLIHHRGAEDEKIARYYVDGCLQFMTGSAFKKPQTKMAISVILGLCGEAGPQMHYFHREESPTESEHGPNFRDLQDTDLWDSVIDESGFGLRGATLDLCRI
ncbi:uncharacterized protein N7496_001077 [Penicillium cataractarum]|uniref:Zn(2)-C6 fungal-type domain-containing protein n=1 Tax=Penicillium cataractarum TaxID=2100454 RepID=A0A9W9VVN8_9EURO|nr:uncharacterized protein N7496_001077 [Penicillium cataractarum]KAJ5390009.1 hypothetical protein N7496_001077 [Penicillium cataractarum]